MFVTEAMKELKPKQGFEQKVANFCAILEEVDSQYDQKKGYQHPMEGLDSADITAAQKISSFLFNKL